MTSRAETEARATLRYALYVRVAQGGGAGRARVVEQLAACRAAVRAHLGAARRGGCTPFIDVGASGATVERPALRRMLAGVEAGAFDVVVASDLARLTRSPAHLLGILRRTRRRGVTVLVPGEDATTLERLFDLAVEVRAR